MKSKHSTPVVVLSALAFLAAFASAGGRINNVFSSLFGAYGPASAQEAGISKVVFTVKCYDEGKAALRGLKGVQKIETGFHYFNETDTVYYDPEVITIEEMESALKKAGTYVKTGK